MMERDTGKYALYYSAILDACSFIKHKMQRGRWCRRRCCDATSAQLGRPGAVSAAGGAGGDAAAAADPEGLETAGAQTLRVVIVGPGTGRLVQYCFDIAASVGINCVAHLFEANATVVRPSVCDCVCATSIIYSSAIKPSVHSPTHAPTHPPIR